MSTADGLPSSQRRWVMGCILLGLVLSSLDSSIANIALPVISRALSTTDAAVVWVVNSYQLAATVSLLPVAALSESLGLKRVYAAGLVLFTLASLSCAMSPTLAVLVGARIVQGLGGACMSVAGMALVRGIYPRSILSRGIALVALAVAISAALGPTIAAFILSVATWHWLFLVNVPLGCVAVAVFLGTAPPGVRNHRELDVSGALLNALALGLIVVGVGTLGTGETFHAGVEIATGVVCLGLLIAQQSRRTTPLLPLDLMKIPVFSLSAGASVCAYAAQILAYVSLPFFFQTGLHLSPVETGFLLTPWPLMVAVSAPIAGRLIARWPAAMVASAGIGLLAAGLVLLAKLPATPERLDIIWRMALCGIGFGLFQTPNNTVMMTSGPIERSGAASGMNAMARYVGWSLGSATAALIFGLGQSHATIACLETAAAIAVVGGLLSGARGHGRLSPPGGARA
jgi:DHA2 family multidrug resistance protein-like MFS transporter